MAVEKIRGCGFRKCGGLYLVGNGIVDVCDRLPLNLPKICATCGAGIKPHRGFQWINPQKLFDNHKKCNDKPTCMMCYPPDEQSGLMWVGNRWYTPQKFIEEALNLGVSKRISHIPKGFEIGKTIIYLAHRKAGTKTVEEPTNFGEPIKKRELCPAIFYVIRPKRIEKLIWKKDATTENILELEKRGITPIIIPDGDKDHDPKKSISQDIKDHKKPKYKDLKDAF